MRGWESTGASNMWSVTIIGCLLVVNKISTTSSTQHSPQHSSIPYQFGYTVQVEDTGDYKTHQEVNDGKEVRGAYSVGEPNGDLRVVNYTADIVNGFRAMVSVQPGASPVRARQHRIESDNTNKPSEEISSTSPHTQHITIQPKPNITEDKFTVDPTQNNNTKLQENIENNNSTSKGTVKIANTSLFDVLPGLDKHVPKIEYIVEEDYENSDGIPLYLKNIDLDLSDKPQVIPVKVQEDPNDKSLELVESDSETKGNNESLTSGQDLQHSLKEGVSLFQTTTIVEKITTTDKNKTDIPQYNSSLKSSTADQTKINFSQRVKDENKTAVTDKQNIAHKTDKPVAQDSKMKLSKTVEDQTLQQNFTKNKSNYEKTDNNQIKDGVLHPTIDDFSKIKETRGDTVQTQETILRPDNNMILAALMLPLPPVIKFTCMPDITDESGIKIAPFMSHTSPTSPNVAQYPARNAPMSSLQGQPVPTYSKNTIKTPTVTTTHPQYPVKNAPASNLQSQPVLAYPKNVIKTPTITTMTHPQYPASNAPMSNLHGLPVPPHPKNTIKTPTMITTDLPFPVRNIPTSNLHGLSTLPYPRNTIKTPTNPQYQINNNKLYPFSGIHFSSNSGLFQLPSMIDPHLYSSKNPGLNISYNPITSNSSQVDQAKTTLSAPTVEITPSPPTKSYQTSARNGNPTHKTQNFIHNRQSPLYPIPYPWIYHPVRPHGYHPRHLPVFVLPMSHNVNFARTFDPESIDKHNN